MTDTTTDLLGNPLTEDEAELLRIYESLKAFVEKGGHPPVVDRGVKNALGLMNVLVNDLGIRYEHLYDQGV